MEFPTKGRLLPLPVNIRLGQKGQSATNTLAYYGAGLIRAVKSFKAEVQKELDRSAS